MPLHTPPNVHSTPVRCHSLLTPSKALNLIVSKMRKQCDLGHITDPHRRAAVGDENATLRLGDDDTALAFELMVKPNRGGHIVRAGDYQLDIVVAAENARPLQKTVEIML